MANQPKTPVTGMRIPLNLKAAAKRVATARGLTLTGLVCELLEREVEDH